MKIQHKKSGDPVPSIAESDATGEIAELYQDIRETLGMPFVNLIWRALGAIPGGLKWTWLSMKPLYESGEAYCHANQLRDGQSLPKVPTLPMSALRAVGIDIAAERAIRNSIDGYDRGNPLNIVTFSALLGKIQNREPTKMEPLGVPCSPLGTSGKSLSLMNFDEMNEATGDMVRAVNLLGAEGEAKTIQVSLPRNLAHYPGFLTIYWTLLAPLHENGALIKAVHEVLAEGQRRGDQLIHLLGNPERPSYEIIEEVRKTLELLVPGAMGRMIPVVSLLKQMLGDAA